MKVKAHYDRHLADFYAWMTGDFQAKQMEHQDIFRSFGVVPRENKVAIDLGAGHGIQSVALAHLGFEVVSVDFSKQLLVELNVNKGNLPIEVVESDIMHYLETMDSKAGLIICMGDTLTHLDSLPAVEKLFRLVKEQLVQGGKVMLSFRDLSTELTHENRFIPVKSDENRILTCFLEYFQDYVMVHDILWERNGGGWSQRVSAYPKLRLAERRVDEMLSSAGMKIIARKSINRMIFLLAENV